MSLMADFLDDTRDSARVVLKVATWVAGICLAAFVLVSVTVVYSHRQSMTTALPDDVDVSALPSAMLDAFTCVGQGEAKCVEYDQATAWLAQNVATASQDRPAGLLYTPLTAADPGTPAEYGLRRVVLGPALSDADWAAVAAAVTLDGRATSATVTEDSTTKVAGEALGGEYALPATGAEPATTGVMTFDFTERGPVLLSVVYTPEG